MLSRAWQLWVRSFVIWNCPITDRPDPAKRRVLHLSCRSSSPRSSGTLPARNPAPDSYRRNVEPGKLLQCRQELIRARRDIAAVFADVDLLVTPTTPIPAPAIAELKQNPDILRPRELLLLRNTRPINVWGLPAISIPCGFTPAGLPIGLQIIGPHWGEARVLQLAHAYEQATAWHKRIPCHPERRAAFRIRETQHGLEGPLCIPQELSLRNFVPQALKIISH